MLGFIAMVSHSTYMKNECANGWIFNRRKRDPSPLTDVTLSTIKTTQNGLAYHYNPQTTVSCIKLTQRSHSSLGPVGQPFFGSLSKQGKKMGQFLIEVLHAPFLIE